MRVVVCGGREYNERQKLFEALDKLHDEFRFTTLINGGARGADKLAREWAQERGVELRIFRANWTGYGPFAGPLRNRRMLVEGRPELVVAFPGGKGTADMTRQATQFGVPVRKVG